MVLSNSRGGQAGLLSRLKHALYDTNPLQRFKRQAQIMTVKLKLQPASALPTHQAPALVSEAVQPPGILLQNLGMAIALPAINRALDASPRPSRPTSSSGASDVTKSNVNVNVISGRNWDASKSLDGKSDRNAKHVDMNMIMNSFYTQKVLVSLLPTQW